MSKFYIFARKINKVPEFYTTFARKMPNFTYCLPEKKFFRDFFSGWGATPSPSSPTPMAGPQASHQLNPALIGCLNYGTTVVVQGRKNCTETPGVCHTNAECTLVSPEVCVTERPIVYRCVCNQGYSGDGTYCTGERSQLTLHYRLVT